MDLHRAQVREEPESTAQREQRLFRADRGRWVGPLRPADRPEQDGIDGAARLDVLGPDRHPVGIDRGAAREDLRPVDREAESLAGRVDDPARRADDLGPDPVARDRRHAVLRKAIPRHGRPCCVRWFAKATATPLISAPWSLFVATR